VRGSTTSATRRPNGGRTALGPRAGVTTRNTRAQRAGTPARASRRDHRDHLGPRRNTPL